VSNPAERQALSDRHIADDSAEVIEEILEAPQRPGPSGFPTDRFLDREESWLTFNARVLELAQDEDRPLLERVRFCAIFASNLDEFFMVRVAGVRRRIASGIAVAAASGLTPTAQLARLSERAQKLSVEHARTFCQMLQPELRERGIEVLRWEQLPAEEQLQLHTFFQDRVYPVLTPLAVDPAHPFPYISGLSLNLAVVARDPATGEESFARVKVPESLPRLLPLRTDGQFLLLEDLIRAHLPQLFTGMQLLTASVFRVTRNEDLELEEEDADNLLVALERELSRRRSGVAVRLEVEEAVSDRVLELLARELDVDEHAIYRLPPPLDLADLSTIADLDRPELRYPPFVPATPAALRADEDTSLFSALRATDVLVHHPYDSFATTVQRFIGQAAHDPDVLAIKQTLYRTSGDSPVVDSLIDAAKAGKQVLVIVEIKARFDEEANIRWARQLERAGCHVVYGLVGLKTHCKLSLVVRREKGGSLRRYAHVGTGNYNPRTAAVYEDLGLLTADPDVCADIADLFNHLSGHTRHHNYRRLLVAPDTARDGILDRIRLEVAAATAGRPSGIFMKLNSLVDEQMIDALYTASRAGVPIKLAIRSRCTIRPGVPGLSETITVRSIVGRFLEHSRIQRFHAGGADEIWIGSADLMGRNLDRRVEALVDVRDEAARVYLTDLIDLLTSEQVEAWYLQPDGGWVRHRDENTVDLHEELLRRHGALPQEVEAAAATGSSPA
jgi:polyphosphate kinase